MHESLAEHNNKLFTNFNTLTGNMWKSVQKSSPDTIQEFLDMGERFNKKVDQNPLKDNPDFLAENSLHYAETAKQYVKELKEFLTKHPEAVSNYPENERGRGGEKVAKMDMLRVQVESAYAQTDANHLM
jgi:hypothetical protein